MAEKEGFEPSRPFRGLHDFQSCALDQLGDFSIAVPVAKNICTLMPLKSDSVIIIAEVFGKSSPESRFFQIFAGTGSGAGDSSLPPRRSASAQIGDDVVHGMVHGDTQLVDTLTHLRFHGLPAAGRHHPHGCAGHETGAHTDPKSGTNLHNQVTPFRHGGSMPPENKKHPGKKYITAIRRGAKLS